MSVLVGLTLAIAGSVLVGAALGLLLGLAAMAGLVALGAVVDRLAWRRKSGGS